MRMLAVLLILAAWQPADAHRSSAAKAAFQRETPCPSTGRPGGPCAGYVVDHVTPLACGGVDLPKNMQYQTVADGKAKDRVELKQCGLRR